MPSFAIGKAKISIPSADFADENSSVRFATFELEYYLERAFAHLFEVVRDGTGDGYVKIERGDLGDDCYLVKLVDGNLCVHGGKRGVIYAVYEILERLGCRFFSLDCEKVPDLSDKTQLDIPDEGIFGKPYFEFRSHNYYTLLEPRFAAKCRINGGFRVRYPDALGGSISYAGPYVHSFDRALLPVSEFGAKHPEYFALVNGKRNLLGDGRTQPCLTNKDVLKICTKRVRKLLLENPQSKIVSISQNDSLQSCECEECKRIDREEGSKSGTMLRFVNAVAEALEGEFPDVVFDTLAYQYTRSAPLKTRPRHNVCVRLCSIESCFLHHFEERCAKGGNAAHFVDDLEAWGKISNRIYIWDYVTSFSNYAMPYPNLGVLAKNIRTMAKNNVKGVFEQGCYASRGSVDFNELRTYLIAKLLWNPYIDEESVKQEFMDYYYGDAAPFLMEYLRLIEQNARACGEHLGFNDGVLHQYLDEHFIREYFALFDKARNAVLGDAVRYFRVEKARLALRWVELKRGVQLLGKPPTEANNFFADWRAMGLSRLDEWVNIERTHHALLDKRWRGTEYLEHWTNEGPEYR